MESLVNTDEFMPVVLGEKYTLILPSFECDPKKLRKNLISGSIAELLAHVLPADFPGLS